MRTTVESGVTLVAVRVRCDEPRTVRVTNELDGPVWPPRTNGVPDDGWTESSYEGRVRPDSPLAVGYATPAPPEEPVVSVEIKDGETGENNLDAVRDLADPRPPRDALPASVPPAVEAWLDDIDGRRVGREERRVLARAARLHERGER